MHFLQIGLYDDMKKYDYGKNKNMDVYGKELPPNIPL